MTARDVMRSPRARRRLPSGRSRAASASVSERVAPDSAPPFDGGCACGAVRYRLQAEPMFVHCCHCTRCQRETGGPFAHHAMIEHTQFSVLAGELDFALVPTDSGGKHWVARCPRCRTAMWNEHGSRTPITRYVRVGTLDEPSRFPPAAHIFVRSKQPWLVLAPEVPSFSAYYDATKTWPAASRARWAAAKAARAGSARAQPARRKRA